MLGDGIAKSTVGSLSELNSDRHNRTRANRRCIATEQSTFAHLQDPVTPYIDARNLSSSNQRGRSMLHEFGAMRLAAIEWLVR